jgi:hypothetical protein
LLLVDPEIDLVLEELRVLVDGLEVAANAI